jgi:hypothetical protein
MIAGKRWLNHTPISPYRSIEKVPNSESLQLDSMLCPSADTTPEQFPVDFAPELYLAL